MVTELDKLRDEMAEANANKFYHAQGDIQQVMPWSDCKESFQAGWSALLKHLSEAAGELDEKAMDKESNVFAERSERVRPSVQTCFAAGASWQFDRMSARVGLALQRWHKQAATIKQLEDRLKECSDKYLALSIKYHKAADKLIGDKHELQDKLSASEEANQNFSQLLIIAEAKIEELTEHLNAYKSEKCL
jgi:hypothetical protein